MKSFMKMLPVCAGIIALASCGSDDWFNTAADGNADFSDKVVFKVTMGDQPVTRSYADANLLPSFTDDDVLRVYDSKMQKYDVFTHQATENGNFFIVPKDEVRVDKVSEDGAYDYKYALFGTTDNQISYAGWKDDKNIALLKISDKYVYDEKESSTREGVVTYKSIIPMFGVVVNPVSEHQTADKSWENLTLYTLAARYRVTFENGQGLGVKAVRARSLKITDQTTYGNLTFTKKEEVADISSCTTSDGAPNLSGWFEAVLDDEISSNSGEGLRPLTEEGVIDNGKASNVIEVEVDPSKMADYTNVVSFPIVPGEYDLIMFEYTKDDAPQAGADDERTWYYIGRLLNRTKADERDIKRTSYFAATISEDVIADGITQPGIGEDTNGNIFGLQSLLNKYAALGKKMDISVNKNSGEIDIKDFEGYREQFHTLVVPELKEDITLNIYGKITGTGNTLYIQGGSGEGTLTINYVNADNAVVPNIDIKAANNVVLSSIEDDDYKAGYEGNITVNKTGDIALDGKFAGEVEITKVANLELKGEFEKAVAVATDGNVILNGATTDGFKETVTVTKAAKADLSGAFTKAVTISGVTGDITLGGTFKDNVNVGTEEASTSKVVLSGTTQQLNVYANNFEETQTGNANGGDANAILIHASESVKLSGNNGVVNVYGAGELTIDGNVSYLIRYGTGKATISGTAGYVDAPNTGTIEVTSTGAVTNGMNLNGTGSVTVKSETFNAAVNIAEKANITINLEAGNISTLTNYAGKSTTIKTYGAATITSVDEKVDDETAAITAYWTDATSTSAVTAQKDIYTAAQLKALQGSTTVTDVVLYADVKAEEGKTIAWTSLAIYNNKLSGSDNVTFNGNNHSISNLSLTGGNNTGFFSRIGVTGSFTGKVIVKDLTLNYSGITGNNYVGGLIGNLVGVNVEIDGVKVNAEKISGQSYVGGIIGMMASGANVELKNGSDVVSVDEFSLNGTVTNFGRFGMLVGSINDEASKFEASDVDYTNSLTQEMKNSLQFYKNTKTLGSTTKSFTGSTKNEIGYSPKATKGNVKINGVEFEVESTVANTADRNINWFDGPLESEINK